LRDVGYGCLTTSVVSTTLRSAVYAGVARTRPVTAAGDQFDVEVPGGEWGVHSFFSGHSMNAFGCATYLGSRYSLGVGEPLLYAVAASISFARMSDRYHWSSDVYLGSLAGIAVGRTIARRALRRESMRDAADVAPSGAGSWLSGLRAAPVPGGVSVSWQRSF
jgi:membrane-associated phospholipid phosphatase